MKILYYQEMKVYLITKKKFAIRLVKHQRFTKKMAVLLPNEHEKPISLPN